MLLWIRLMGKTQGNVTMVEVDKPFVEDVSHIQFFTHL